MPRAHRVANTLEPRPATPGYRPNRNVFDEWRIYLDALNDPLYTTARHPIAIVKFHRVRKGVKCTPRGPIGMNAGYLRLTPSDNAAVDCK